MAILVKAPYEYFMDTDGTPLENGYVYIGERGENAEVNQITVYWDDELTIPAAQPLRTIGGHISRYGSPSNIYTDTGYSILVKDINSVFITSSNGSELVDSPSIGTLNTISELIAYTNAKDNTSISVLGYSSVNDGGGGIFNYDSSLSATNNGGTIINGWVRQYSGPINVRWFGAKEDGTDDTSYVQSAIDYASSIGGGVVDITNNGGTLLFTTINLKNNVTLRGNGGKVIRGLVRGTSINSKLLNIRFDYNNVNPSGTVIYYIGSTFKIEGCTFENIPSQIIISFTSSNITIINNLIRNCDYAIRETKVDDVPANNLCGRVLISGNNISNIALGTAIELLTLRGSDPTVTDAAWLQANTFFDETIISNNVISGCGSYAVIFRGWNCTFSGNVVKSSSSVIMQGGNISAVGNVIRNSASMGIDFGNVTYGTISGNIIDTTEHSAIEINACYKVSVGNNSLYGYLVSAAQTSYARSAIWIHGATATTVPARASQHISISNNVLTKSTSSNNIYCVGIEDVASYGISVNNNDFVNSLVALAGFAEIKSASQDVAVINNIRVTSITNDRVEYKGTLFAITIAAE